MKRFKQLVGALLAVMLLVCAVPPMWTGTAKSPPPTHG